MTPDASRVLKSMKKQTPRIYPAHIAGILVWVAAAAFFFIHPLLSAAALFCYVAACIAACFIPQSQFLGPVIHRGRTGRPWVSLTFDDGPAEPTTRKVLDLLDRHQAKATFFVTGQNAKDHPDIIADIITRGHGIGNHSLNHFPFLMMKSSRDLYREVGDARTVLRSLGVETKAFRPPVGIVNPRLAGVLNALNMFCVTFSRRAGDAGNRRVGNLSGRILKKVKADDIVLLHDVPAPDTGDDKQILQEMEKILAGIKNKGLRIVPLHELIGRPFMTDWDR